TYVTMNRHTFFIPNILTKFSCQFLGLCLLQLGEASECHDNTNLFISVIVVGLDSFHQLSKCTFVLTRKENRTGHNQYCHTQRVLLYFLQFVTKKKNCLNYIKTNK
uniref:Uncharacterized protein n=1 Tax=Kryptolebias marmoratus TaxID=37003 RepID=A0A3Q3AA00_KRYMA